MLYAYLDETGTHTESPMTIVGGLVASPDTWEALERDWCERLGNLNLTYFHALDCEAGNGQYCSLSRPLRESLFAGLAQIISTYKPLAVYTAVDRNCWSQSRARGQIPFDSPYQACFEFCLQQLAKWSVKMNGEPIALTFAEQREYGPQGEEIYGLYKKSIALSDSIDV